jgi:hypothetical protein
MKSMMASDEKFMRFKWRDRQVLSLADFTEADVEATG